MPDRDFATASETTRDVADETQPAHPGIPPLGGTLLSPRGVLRLQSSAGNAAVLRLLEPTVRPTVRTLARQSACQRRLDAPPVVPQNDTWTCWAAALESWSYVSSEIAWSQDELIEAFATDKKGGLTPEEGWPLVARAMQIQYQVLPGGQIGAPLLISKLNQGYVVLGYQLESGASHMNVVHGVNMCGGKEPTLSIMDPQEEGALEERPISFYSAKSGLIVGWPGPQFYLPPNPLQPPPGE
jgi:hypothetical protein